MIRKFDLLIMNYRPGAEANAGLLVGGFLGAFGGLFGSMVGALLGFMVDRVRAALAPERNEENAAAEDGTHEDERPAWTGGRDPRAVLGLGAEAGPAEIRRAWRRISKQCHPDTGARDEESARLFREAREAYEALVGDKTKRPLA